MILGHVIQLEPNKQHAYLMKQSCDAARHAYNWAIARWKDEFNIWKEFGTGPKPSGMFLRAIFTKEKADRFPWMEELSSYVSKNAIMDLDTAFKNFWNGTAKYPKFKKKSKTKPSFRADNGVDKTKPNAIQVVGKKVKLPVIGWVNMKETPRFSGNIKTARVSYKAGKWFISFTIDTVIQPIIRKNQAVVGVDLGIKTLAVVSDGINITKFEGPKALHKAKKKLRKLHKSVSRKVKGSANREKAKLKLQKCYAEITNKRNDCLNKLTTHLAVNYYVVGIEDLNVSGMMKNHKLARAISDVGMYEFRRQLEYKTAMYGSQLVMINRFFPSSKTCNDCGHVNQNLKLSDREWVCDDCGVVHDRDENAAKNIRDEAVSYIASACGVASAGIRNDTKLATSKQEIISLVSNGHG